MPGPAEERRRKERRARLKTFGKKIEAAAKAVAFIQGAPVITDEQRAKKQADEAKERVIANRKITKRVESSREARNLNNRDWSYFLTGERHRPIKAGDNILVPLPDDATFAQFAEAMGRSGEITTILGVVPAIDAATTDPLFDPADVRPEAEREAAVASIIMLSPESRTELYAYWNFIKANPSFAGKPVSEVAQSSAFQVGLDSAVAYQQAIEQGDGDLALEVAQDSPEWARTTISMSTDPQAVRRNVTTTFPNLTLEIDDDTWEDWLAEAGTAGFHEVFLDWMRTKRNQINASYLGSGVLGREFGGQDPVDYLDNNLDGFVDWFNREQPLETRGRDAVIDPMIDAVVRGLPIEIASEIRGELKRQLLLRQGESGEIDKTRVWSSVPNRLKDSLVSDAIVVNIFGGHPQYEAIMQHLQASGVNLSTALRNLATQPRLMLGEDGEVLETLGPAVVDGMQPHEILPLLLGQLEQFAPGVTQIANTPVKAGKGEPQPVSPTQTQLFGQFFNPWMRELGVPLHLRVRMERAFINTFFATDDPTQMSLQEVATRLGNTDIPAFMRQVTTDYIEQFGGDEAVKALSAAGGDPFAFIRDNKLGDGVLTDGEFARRLATILEQRVVKQVAPKDAVTKLIQTNVFGKAFANLPADLQAQLASVGTTAAETFALGAGIDLREAITDPNIFGSNVLGAVRNAISAELRDLLGATKEGRKLIQLARINEGGDVITFIGKHVGPLAGLSLDEIVKQLARVAPRDVQPGESEDVAAARREIAEAAAAAKVAEEEATAAKAEKARLKPLREAELVEREERQFIFEPFAEEFETTASRFLFGANVDIVAQSGFARDIRRQFAESARAERKRISEAQAAPVEGAAAIPAFEPQAFAKSFFTQFKPLDFLRAARRERTLRTPVRLPSARQQLSPTVSRFAA